MKENTTMTRLQQPSLELWGPKYCELNPTLSTNSGDECDDHLALFVVEIV